MWDEITYQFPNVNDADIEFWEWISIIISHFTRHVVTYLYCNTEYNNKNVESLSDFELTYDIPQLTLMVMYG